MEAQKALIDSQAEMIKDLSKKMLENEQKLVDLAKVGNPVNIVNVGGMKHDRKKRPLEASAAVVDQGEVGVKESASPSKCLKIDDNLARSDKSTAN